MIMIISYLEGSAGGAIGDINFAITGSCRDQKRGTSTAILIGNNQIRSNYDQMILIK